MSNVAIRCQGLSKRYRIGGYTDHYKVLRDVISDVAAAPFRRLKSVARNGNGHRNDYIWALDDVSFDAPDLSGGSVAIETVAAVSEADRESMAARLANRAVCMVPPSTALPSGVAEPDRSVRSTRRVCRSRTTSRVPSPLTANADTGSAITSSLRRVRS